MKKTVTTNVGLDKRYKTRDNTYSVRLRVTHNRVPKYYQINLNHTALTLTEEEFEKIMGTGKKNPKEKNIFIQLCNIESRAKECIDRLRVFTFYLFDRLYLENRGATDNVYTGFENYAAELKSNEQISTAQNYITTKNSLLKFSKNPNLSYIVSSHFMRKTFGRRVWENNHRSEESLIKLSEVFGHSNIAITRRYLGIRQEEIADVYLQL
ncbi:MAG: hypothetical protein JST52_07960 [Bacteroidetes bacterium]|nr:hypothetical protein [Bacteroidota bacterium]MBS1741016.1 hypothetical protein [Bacteroidota bacterium]